MTRTIGVLLATLLGAAVFTGLVHALLVASHVSEPAATTVYGLTVRRLWATSAVLLALLSVAMTGFALARPVNRATPERSRRRSSAAMVIGLLAAVSGGLNLAAANGGPGSGNGVVGGAAAVVLGLTAVAIGELARRRVHTNLQVDQTT